MINVKKVKKFCNEDISLIENCDKAINDETQTWHCHHRKETDEGLSAKKLIELGLYYGRPANELIFLTHGEHSSLHHSGKHLSDEEKRKRSEANKGKAPWNKGKKTGPLSKEHKQKVSVAVKGEKNGMYGKPANNKDKHRVYDENGKYHYEF